ncbi:MAG: hypothetical protein D6731_12955 [Planctomycetota bacterium]|nr:MAG: hypothetical protein D6731_12955 [Planctomycetota bacterium]
MPASQRPQRSERGSSLALVLVFALAAFGLVGAMLLSGRLRMRAQGERTRGLALQAALQAGMAHALHEINRDHLEGPFDPGADGVGALLLGPDGRAGWPVAPGFPTLGRYRTTIDSSRADGRLVLTVVAAVPNFESPGRILSAARMEVRPGALRVGRGPFVLSGEASGRASDPRRVPPPRLENGRLLSVVDPTALHPAVTITDDVYRAAFLAALAAADAAGEPVDLRGARAGMPGVPAVGADTVAGENEAPYRSLTASDLAAALEATAASLLPAANHLADAAEAQGALRGSNRRGALTLNPSGRGPATVVLPDGLYSVPDDLNLLRGLTLEGKGTLLVGRRLRLEPGSALRWQGRIIVGIDDRAELRVGRGSRLEVDGVLAVDSARKKARLRLEQRSATAVDGALLVLAAGSEGRPGDFPGELRLKRGAQLAVDGLVVLGGEHVDLRVDDRAELDVRGSFNVVLSPKEDIVGLHRLEFRSRALVNMSWDSVRFERGVTVLRDFSAGLFPAGNSPFPYTLASYWEVSGEVAAAEQDAALAGGAPVGMP